MQTYLGRAYSEYWGWNLIERQRRDKNHHYETKISSLLPSVLIKRHYKTILTGLHQYYWCCFHRFWPLLPKKSKILINLRNNFRISEREGKPRRVIIIILKKEKVNSMAAHLSFLDFLHHSSFVVIFIFILRSITIFTFLIMDVNKFITVKKWTHTYILVKGYFRPQRPFKRLVVHV